jgi:hypothetical protein
MTKTAKIDFYCLEMPKSATLGFETFLQQIYVLPEEKRTQLVNATPVRLHRLTQVENYLGNKFVEGEMVRIRMSGLPSIAGIQGGVKDLKLPSDQGLGEQTAFLYHPSTNVLLFHTTQVGVSLPSFLRYFELLGSSVLSLFQGELCVDPLIVKNALMRLEKIRETRNFEFRIAKVTNPEVFKEQGFSIKEEIELMEKYETPSLGVKISTINTKSNPLNNGNIIGTAKSLLRIASRNPEQVTRIRISGADDEEQAIYIKNLLKDTMRESIKLKVGQERNIPYAIRQEALREAWQKRQDEILSMIAPKKV